MLINLLINPDLSTDVDVVHSLGSTLINSDIGPVIWYGMEWDDKC